MAYFGVQHPGAGPLAASQAALARIAGAFGASDGPGSWDRARYRDEAGYTNILSIGYRDAPEAFDRWFAAHGTAWTHPSQAAKGLGTFVEVLRPAVERFETLFSSTAPEGVAAISERMSDPVREHAYWGGARDRIPLSQTHDLKPSGSPRVITEGALQRVLPHENICLIRSGQDWTATREEERRLYLRDVEPVLRAGMDFLRDDGLTVGCFANRYMTVLDRNGRDSERTFGMSWWRGLSELERWAESHPTHVAIFGAAMKYLGALGSAAQLRLHHEVTVAAADEQHFEYLGCHSDTGMLRSAK
jgi:aldoxime dehydratase